MHNAYIVYNMQFDSWMQPAASMSAFILHVPPTQAPTPKAVCKVMCTSKSRRLPSYMFYNEVWPSSSTYGLPLQVAATVTRDMAACASTESLSDDVLGTILKLLPQTDR